MSEHSKVEGVAHEDRGSTGVEKPLDFPGEKVGLADMGGHAEQGDDKVELLSRFRPVVLEGGPDQTVAEFGMLVSEDILSRGRGLDRSLNRGTPLDSRTRLQKVIAVSEHAGEIRYSQRRTARLSFARASSRRRVLICANSPGGMKPWVKTSGRPGSGDSPALDHSSILCSDTITQLGVSSRPKACLTRAGISMPAASPAGRVWVIGSSTT